MERTWEISDIDGSNKRTVTLAQYRAELDAAKIKATAIYNRSVAAWGSNPNRSDCNTINRRIKAQG